MFGPHLRNGNNNSSCLTRLPSGLNETMWIEHGEACLAYFGHSVSGGPCSSGWSPASLFVPCRKFWCTQYGFQILSSLSEVPESAKPHVLHHPMVKRDAPWREWGVDRLRPHSRQSPPAVPIASLELREPCAFRTHGGGQQSCGSGTSHPSKAPAPGVWRGGEDCAGGHGGLRPTSRV